MSDGNSNGNNEASNALELLTEMAKLQGGVSCVTVKDGVVFMFNKETLQNLLQRAEASEKGQVVVFIKRPDVQ